MRSLILVGLGVAIGLAIGVMAGALIFASDSEGSETEKQDSWDRSRVETRRSNNGEGGRLDSSEPIPIARASETLPSSGGVENSIRSASGIRESIGSLAARKPQPTTGDGQLGGRIADLFGKPLEGVTVIATWVEKEDPGSIDRGGAAPDERAFTERAREILEKEERLESRRRRTKTSPDGSFRFEDLVQGTYRLEAFRRGFEFSSDGGSAERAKTDSEVNFTAAAIMRVPVRIESANGESFSEVRIRRKGPGSTRTYLWTPSRPHVHVPSGRHELRATVGDDDANEGLASEWTQVLVSADSESVDEVTLRLDSRRGIFGTITMPSGMNSGSVMVALDKSPGNKSADQLFKENTNWNSIPGGATRKFRFADLEKGTYALGCFFSYGDSPLDQAMIEVKDGFHEHHLKIPSVRESDGLIAEVLSPDGRRLHKVRFSIQKKDEYAMGIAAVTRDDGSHWFSIPKPFQKEFSSGEPDATFFLKAHAKEFGETKTVITNRQSRISLQFQEQSHLKVRVRGLDGHPLESRLYLSLSTLEEDSRWSSNRVRAVAETLLGPVVPGEYQLSVLVDRWRQVEAIPVTIGRGSNEMEIVPPEVYDIVVDFSDDADAYDNFSAKRVSDGYQAWGGSEDGVARFSGLPSGSYQIEGHGKERIDTMIVSVPPAQTVRFEPMGCNALEVTIFRDSSVYRKAGFQSGDVIIEIDGMTWETYSEARSRKAMLEASLNMPVKIIRSGASVTLDVSLKEAEWDDGASLKPVWRR